MRQRLVWLTCALWALWSTPAAADARLFDDDFSSGDLSGFLMHGDVEVTGFDPHVRMTDRSWIRFTVSAVGYDDIVLAYHRTTRGLDPGEVFRAEWFNGVGWVPLESTQDGGDVRHRLNARATDRELSIRFRLLADGTDKVATLDNVVVTGTACPPSETESCAPPLLDLIVTNNAPYEQEGIEGKIRLRFNHALRTNLILPFDVTGDIDPTKGSATPDDYELLHDGEVVGSPLRIPAGTKSYLISVRPVADTTAEVPETLVVSVPEGGGYQVGRDRGTLRIRDALPTAANRRLFFAPLRPEPGVVTVASGTAILQLDGDNNIGEVSLDWSALTSPQTAAHIHVKDPISGPHIADLPNDGPFDDHVWPLRAATLLTTDQMVLDALLGGQLYVNVHSELYPAGEIRGDLAEVNGSTEFTPPADPRPIAPLTGDALRHDLIRFLNQATFGATPDSLAELEALVADNAGDRIAGMSAWIDQQVDLTETPSPSLFAFTDASRQLYERTTQPTASDKGSAWWTFARYAPDQLRQRVGFALSEILVVSDANPLVHRYSVGAADYQDRLNAGAFGSYGDLLAQVSRHPIMGTYLSHLRNQRTSFDEDGAVVSSPDENYAREIMQLFSIGLVKLHPDGSFELDEDGLPIPTYDNDVITEMAKVFTGYSFGATQNDDGDVILNDDFFLGNGNVSPRYRWRTLMRMFDAFHEPGDKTIFDDIVIHESPEATGEREVDQVHAALMEHPSTAPFISRRLIQRFVTSNPTHGYVFRVATAFASSGGNLERTIRAILLDPEARDLALRAERGFGKQKEPVIRLLHLLRLTRSYTQLPISLLATHGYQETELAKLPADATMIRMNGQTGTTNSFGQRPLGAPSVFNFFLPDFTPIGPVGQLGLVSPESQIATEYQVYRTTNVLHDYVLKARLNGGTPPPGFTAGTDDLRRDISDLNAMHADAVEDGPDAAAQALVAYLDLYLNAGLLTDRFEGAAEPNPLSMIIEDVADMTHNWRVREALYIMTANSYSQIQR